MFNVQYNWKRFWCPRTGNLNLSDGGYLYDPDSEYGRIYNPEVISFKSIAGKQCLVLLGEPGIGKSRTMQLEIESLQKTISDEGGRVFKLDLRSYGSEERLIKNLFESPEVVAWVNGDYRLHLFLDSLDECLLRIDTLATLLFDELSKYPVGRLNLRIACRTAEWPVTLEAGLRDLWGSDNFEAYELAPLRRVDVIEAAKGNGINPDIFLEEISGKEVVSFAIKPVTLQFLINTFKKGGGLPSTQSDLYYIGCLKNCEEQSQQRIDGKLIGKYSANQRLAVASRIAAITQFTNQYAIWTGRDFGDVPIEDVPIPLLIGGKENVDGDEFEVTEIAIRETLDTGLFSSRGPHRMGWAHQTYAEFLAAKYIVQNNMALPQIKSLINHSDDQEGKLVPQLHETAAWISCMHPEIFSEVMKTDPEVLLRSDVAKAGAKEREALVHALLTHMEEEKLFDRDLGRNQFKKLCHPKIAEQLLPFIRGSNSIFTRRMAIDIAEACTAQELQHELLEIALNVREKFMIRSEAAHAVSRIAVDDVKANMKLLARGEAGDDPDDELKGSALSALWPNLISSEELFELLTLPKNESLFGFYKCFILYELSKNLNLTVDELIPALNWVKKHTARHELPYDFRDLVDAIMLNAWEQLEAPNIAIAFAETVLPKLLEFDFIFNVNGKAELPKKIANDDYKRRIFMSALLCLISDQNNISHVSFSPFAVSVDIFWMIEQLQLTNDAELVSKWAEMIKYLFDLNEASHVDVVLIASQDVPILAEKFAWLINPVFMDTPEADKMKADFYKRQKWMEKKPHKNQLKPSPQQRISNCLNDFEAGDSSGWWRMNLEMPLESDSTHYGDEFEADLTNLPGWKAGDEDTRARILKSAKKYLIEQDPQFSEWLGTNTVYRPAFAGYRALILLLHAEPESVSKLPNEVWQKWSSIILAYPNESQSKKIQQSLIKMAYDRAPVEVIETLNCLIDKENREYNNIFIINLIEQCWDDRIASVLLQKAMDGETKPENMGCLLGNLLEHSFDEARIFAESLLSFPLPFEEVERKKAVIAAKELFHHTSASHWPFLWSIFQQDHQFGKEVFLQAAYRQRIDSIGTHDSITDMQLADLYVWITNLFPHEEDPKPKGAHWVGPNENVRHFRDGILRQLQHRGTQEACSAIKRILCELPELYWLKWVLLDAKAQARRQSWQPPSPQEILKLASSRRLRLIQNGDQLLEILNESLGELERKLQGETPAAIYLWNEIRKDGKTFYGPKDENRFSDFVKLYLDENLKEKGIVLNREVEIRRGEGNAKGEHTDIHVDAISYGPQKEEYDRVSVIIESKGCWNRELKSAMKVQLVDRYLNDNRCSHGMYLVGWFNCPQWDDEDYRKRDAPQITIEKAREIFMTQADELSVNKNKVTSFIMNTALR
jgi:predicted NACHT family NTPase